MVLRKHVEHHNSVNVNIMYLKAQLWAFLIEHYKRMDYNIENYFKKVGDLCESY